ncbi:MAG: hypothetical protein MK211_04445 [Flavobacteriales bacterium]|jgi:quercetin dioxygenase-like cupin family protein|uniref:hypothetical protein n=1 Tax=Candidatus Ulvibacter alkanivorans TaxID=2267620 RepID=UPI000DF4266B|nr:hypothetical protein [Candidatus Ulvibacter alkanivorans]MCH2489378.1 hypothetical protein [Flavobacteriales bacterium]
MIKEVADSLQSSETPVLKKIYDKNGTKLLVIGLKQGVVLKEHMAPSGAKLIVMQGEIDYNTETSSYRFAQLDIYDIPKKVSHSVVAIEDAVFLLLLAK